MKKRNKKAQFYLIAAVIIIVALSSVASIKNYAITKTEPTRIRDISAELKEEGLRIIDYGIYSNDEQAIDDFIKYNFSSYFLRTTQNTTISFIYGNQTNISLVKYVGGDVGEVLFSWEGTSMDWQGSGFNINPQMSSTACSDLRQKTPPVTQINRIKYSV